jgi:DNA-binding beta-propeller fold protein YncE
MTATGRASTLPAVGSQGRRSRRRGRRILVASIASANAIAIASLALAGTASARTVYVMNQFGSSVSYFPTPANTPVNTISSVNGASTAVFTPDDAYAYVVQGGIIGGNVVNKIRTSDNTSVGTIPVGIQPESIAITPDGSKVYVGSSNPDTSGPLNGHYKISVIHTADDSVTNIDLGSSTTVGAPDRVAVTPDGSQLWAASFARGDNGHSTITVFDTSTDTLDSNSPNPIDLGSFVNAFPTGLAFTPDGTTAYVAEFQGEEVTPIDVATRTAGTNISMSGQFASSIAIAPDGSVAYVTLANGTVPVIDIPANTIRTGTGYPITVGNSPNEVAFTPDGKIAYVANSNSASVSPIDTTASPPVAGTAITVGSAPQGVAIQPDQGPAADFSDTPVAPGTATDFDAGASSDSDGTVADYHWDFGDGHSADTTSAMTSHTYTAGGNYNVTLTVTDNEGCANLLVFTGRMNYCTPHGGQTNALITVPAASSSGGGGGPTGPTGQRAAALKKCKKKHGRARAKCKKKANRLPL